MTRAPIVVDSDRPFDDVLDLVGRDRLRVIVRPGAADTGEILAWCENEEADGFGELERETACRRLGCAAVELVPAQIRCKGDAGGVGGGIVNCNAWIPKEGS